MTIRQALLIAATCLTGTLAMTATATVSDKEQAMNLCGHEIHDSSSLRGRAARSVGWKSHKHHANRSVSFKILGFNDFHGALEQRTLFNRPVGGAAVLAAYFEAEAAESDNGAIIVHAGDHVGASPPVSALLQDEPSIQFLNLLGNKFCRRQFKLHPKCNLVGTLGNHEFDEGVTEMRRLINGGNSDRGPFLADPYRGTTFPYINANVVYVDSGKTVLPPYVIKKVKGVKVAFIGAVLKETPTIVTPTGVAGVAFQDEADAINAVVGQLKRRGVRAIVVTIHQGARQPSFNGPAGEEPLPLDGAIGDIVNRLDDEVDIVVSGHSHGFTNQLANNQNGTPILVTQAFSSGTAYADIDVVVDRKTGDIVEKRSTIITTWADEGPGLTPDQTVAQLVTKAVDIVQPLVERMVGTAAVDITREEDSAGESALGNLIADAQRAATGTDVAFMNPGGIRADVMSGSVTWGDLFTIQPFGNDLIEMDLTGQQIIDLLNQQWSGGNAGSPRILKTSGINYQWDASLPADSRVVAGSVLIGGAPLELNGVYTVTANSFIAAGGDNFTVLPLGGNRVTGPVDLDALISFIEAQPQPFSAEVEGRIQRLN